MIKQIFDADDDILNHNKLMKTYYGRKILAYLLAYGVKYDFCRFYKLTYYSKKAVMFMINSTTVIDSDYELPAEELQMFINMNQPIRVEAPIFVLEKLAPLAGYKRLRRTMFSYEKNIAQEDFPKDKVDTQPSLNIAYDILQGAFPKTQDYGLWITDMSHRIRRNLTHIYMYRGCTTATEIYDIGGNILIGQVATRIEDRGKGYARELLYYLCNKRLQEGKRIHLFALDHRVSFYESIGFNVISEEDVLQREDSQIKSS